MSKTTNKYSPEVHEASKSDGAVYRFKTVLDLSVLSWLASSIGL